MLIKAVIACWPLNKVVVLLVPRALPVVVDSTWVPYLKACTGLTANGNLEEQLQALPRMPVDILFMATESKR